MDFTSNSINTFLLFFIVGIILALIAQLLSQKLYGKFLKALLEAGARDELFSKTLAELGFEKNRIIKYALSHRTSVSFIVEKVTDENGNSRYYIPEEQTRKAEALYRPDSFTLATLLVFVVCLVAVFLICKYIIPYIFD